MAVSWGAQPLPTLPHASVRVFSIKSGCKAFVRVLGPTEGVLLHWRDARSFPCMGPICAQCGTLPAVWKGYAACEVWGCDPGGPKEGWHRWILEITESAHHQLTQFQLG